MGFETESKCCGHLDHPNFAPVVRPEYSGGDRRARKSAFSRHARFNGRCVEPQPRGAWGATNCSVPSARFDLASSISIEVTAD